ncbi:hypothetical protein PF010_g18480 [Phytophthora fragariae]|uniref:Uncharacterized protein n=1 Tax=Phytophthora fragariae TaxID=53985 RepID=A0A6G0KK96_9STRA|nr:hypothetical protein PF010_g18480 [Phytophthora fragariae]KAE9187426.1 hypothetical protein PF004_g22794 [Phytophthora fragariae]
MRGVALCCLNCGTQIQGVECSGSSVCQYLYEGPVETHNYRMLKLLVVTPFLLPLPPVPRLARSLRHYNSPPASLL